MSNCLLVELNTLLDGNDETVSKVAVSLSEWGCCPRCILRFIGLKDQHVFRMLELNTLNDWLKLIRQPQSDSPMETLSRTENETTNIPDSGLTVCVSCLGILQTRFCKPEFVAEIQKIVVKQDFQFSDFFCSLSLPVCLMLREHAIWLSLIETMPSVFTLEKKRDITPIKDVWKWLNGSYLSTLLNVPFNQKSIFEIQLNFSHQNNERECSFLYDLYPNVFCRRKRNRHGWDVFNRANVLKAIDDTSTEKFKKRYNCPPKELSSPCDCDPITCHHEALYFAGRYNKFSRTLSQTPWLIDGIKKFEESVEELICRPLMKSVGAKERKFSASGREDVDVRMLGRGRPFFIEFLNPHKIIFTSQEMEELQLSINTSTSDVSVRDLQIVSKDEISILKEGEEEKTKNYSALCWTREVMMDENLQQLSSVTNLVLKQKTPIRVLHRRPLAVRERVVYSMYGKKIDDHHFVLSLSTQAGTYIKEFVHGDFGRTIPNLSNILKTECDILELDVEEVQLDWPRSLIHT